ncbi:MAG: glutathione peroxidase [Gammaproteobacteria bacterium SG8_15]|jgi:glutaredoxin-like protein|nr:MAG: glutathione peroxidase [Gammaproteobacteria bacterium SG8_15]
MFKNKEGQRVPQVTFKTRQNNEWKDVTSDDVFSGKTVVVFSLPGAFTPTCSSSHVPRFNQLAQSFYANGVDAIVCMSVNDTFVMNEWKKDQDADNIVFIPDGNGEFTEAMGMLVNKDDLGFGKRSWRYSMLVKDGVIDKMFIEPNVPGDPFEVSDADTMLEYINPQAEKPADVTIFTKKGCPYCAKAKALLTDNGVAFEEIVASTTITERTLRAVTGKETYPQVFVNGEYIGDSEALEQYYSKAEKNAA